MSNQIKTHDKERTITQAISPMTSMQLSHNTKQTVQVDHSGGKEIFTFKLLCNVSCSSSDSILVDLCLSFFFFFFLIFLDFLLASGCCVLIITLVVTEGLYSTA